MARLRFARRVRNVPRRDVQTCCDVVPFLRRSLLLYNYINSAERSFRLAEALLLVICKYVIAFTVYIHITLVAHELNHHTRKPANASVSNHRGPRNAKFSSRLIAGIGLIVCRLGTMKIQRIPRTTNTSTDPGPPLLRNSSRASARLTFFKTPRTTRVTPRV